MYRYRIAVCVCLALAASARAETAKELVDASGVTGGLVVHVGCGDAKLTAGLRAGSSYLVHGLDTDAARVAKAREVVRTLGVYGPVSIDRWAGGRLPYVDNTVNLLVVTDPKVVVSRDEVLRVLVPNGAAVINGKRLVKPWPAEIDDWTHWLYGPGNNAVSRDTRVGISRNLQWIDGPLWGRHHNLLPSVSTMVSAKGRLFTIIDEAPIGVRSTADKWALVARDAFNGLVLWRKPITNWGWSKWSALEVSGTMRFKGPDQLFRRLVAVGDTVYVTLGFNEPVAAIDAATGKTIRLYKGTENTSAILCAGGRLVLSRNVLGKRPGKDILAVDAESGKVLWERKGYTGITSRGDELKAFTDVYLTVGKDKAFFLDRDHVVALDLETGKEAWKAPRPKAKKDVFGHYQFNFVNLCTLVYHDGTVFMGQIRPEATNLNKWQKKAVDVMALDAGSGKELWRHTAGTLSHFTPPDLFVRGGLIWMMQNQPLALVGLDVRTGKIKSEHPVADMLVGHHHRCYRNKASANFYLAGEEGIEYIDFRTGALDVHHWMRGACAYGIMPANGLIYLPGHACGCHTNAKLNGFIALADRKLKVEGSRLKVPRVEKGPAYSSISNLKSEISDDDWPVYRRDAARSGHVATDVPAKVALQWKASIGGRLTPPVIAAGKVYVAAKDRNEVVCLSAAAGKVLWRFIADGPVDSPPSICGGRVIFGSRGGSVYALAADDGALVWRFVAAPTDVRAMAFGRLESLWPVSGSVLPLGDKVYFVAGRSMHLDGGLTVYALDAATGKMLQRTQLTADTKVKGEVKGAVLPDILVSDGESIFMRTMKFSAADITARGAAKGGAILQSNDGGLLDDSWINNAFWRYGKAQAQMLVFDGKTVYGVAAQKKLITKSYGQDVFSAGKNGYRLFAVDLGAAAGKAPSKPADRRGKKRKAKKPPTKSRWSLQTSVRAQAMVLAGARLCIAGAPDVVDKADPWGAFEDRKGGVVEIYQAADGKKAGECTLPSSPVYDGMAAAGGRLFLALKDGTVVCMGAER